MTNMAAVGDEGLAPTEEERVRAIHDYSGRHTSRDDPVVFGGREREMEQLAAQCRRTFEGGKGALTVISGIPGAGKTALASRFCKHAEAALGAAVLDIDGGYLSRPQLFARRIAAAQAHVASNGARPGRSMGFGADPAASSQSSLDVGDIGETDDDFAHARMFDMELARAGARRDVGLVLVVDEAQEMDFETAKPMIRLLQHGCPVPLFPMLVGLRHLKRKLEDASLRRLAPGAEIDLHCMPVGDAAKVIAGTARWFGVDRVACSRLSECLAPPTGGFAAHIDAVVAGIAVVMKRNGDMLPDGDGAIAECAAAACVFRKDYYERRLDNADGVPHEFFLALASAVFDQRTGMQRMGGAEPFEIRLSDVREACSAAIAEAAQDDPETFGGMTVAKCLHSAERAGVLEYAERTRTITFPAAPSMARHILDLPEPLDATSRSAEETATASP